MALRIDWDVVVANMPGYHTRERRKELARRVAVSIGTVSNAIHIGVSRDTVQKMGEAIQLPDWRSLVLAKDRSRVDSPAFPTGAETIPLYMFHRRKRQLHNEYFRAAFGSGRHVILLSVMSKDSFKKYRRYLDDQTRLDVLTWNPDTAGEIRGYAKHLRERGNKIRQTQAALEAWDRFSLERSGGVSVYTYKSSPTMQGIIVEKGWAMIELLPFATPTNKRPAILLRYDEPSERKAFEYFWDCFQRLLKSAHPRRAGTRSAWFLPLRKRLGSQGYRALATSA